ncbi:ketopantoate reductase family protein [Mycetocola sp.]|uniref:ketopantoate reductase family protein n=1 Tax=Mycetocola sp. TaxID=1871042 RepID=UPI003989A28D
MTGREEQSLRIAVLGTGANGAAIGSDLVRAGLDVTFIDQWPENVTAIRENGITVQLAEGTTVTPVPVLHLCEVAKQTRPFDVVLVLVKAYDTRWACELIKPHVAADGVVVGVQNGMTGDVIVDVMGADRALAAVIEITSAMYVPGLVERHSHYDRSWFALGAPRPEATHHVAKVASIMRNAGTVEEVEDIDSPKWMKLVLNAGELVPSAILDLSIVEAARHDGMKELMIEAGNEAILAARLLKLQIRPIFGMNTPGSADPDTYMQVILDELLTNYVLTHSRATVLQDWMKQRHSEVNEINGLVVDVLEQFGHPAPVNQAMVEFALGIESGANTPGMHNYEPLAARVTELKEKTYVR